MIEGSCSPLTSQQPSLRLESYVRPIIWWYAAHNVRSVRCTGLVRYCRHKPFPLAEPTIVPSIKAYGR